MRILFNGMRTGFGNNGGSQSIMLTALALAKKGHMVEIWSDTHNQFSWVQMPDDGGVEDPHKPVNPRFRVVKEPLKTSFDVAITVGSNSLETTELVKARAKINWIRNIEVWRKPEAVLMEEFADLKYALWSNSGWIAKKIKQAIGRECDVVYPCVRAESYSVPDRSSRPADEPFTIGYLNSHLHCNPDKKVQHCVEIVGRLRKMADRKIKVVGFGTMKYHGFFNTYLQSPALADKVAMYQSCDLWIQANPNKGLCLSTMEAALCGVPGMVPATVDCGVRDWFPPELVKPMSYSCVDEAVEKALEFMRSSPETIEAARKAFRDHSSAKFQSDANMVKKIEKKLEKLL